MNNRIEAVRVESFQCVQTFVCSVVFLIIKISSFNLSMRNISNMALLRRSIVGLIFSDQIKKKKNWNFHPRSFFPFAFLEEFNDRNWIQLWFLSEPFLTLLLLSLAERVSWAIIPAMVRTDWVSSLGSSPGPQSRHTDTVLCKSGPFVNFDNGNLLYCTITCRD